MPTDATILGFSNDWYTPAFEHSDSIVVSGVALRVISGPYFIATKLAAFLSRGSDDVQRSHDIEDIVAVLAGRTELASEVGAAPRDVREFIGDTLAMLIRDRDLSSAVYGHLPPDAVSQVRGREVERVLRRVIETSRP